MATRHPNIVRGSGSGTLSMVATDVEPARRRGEPGSTPLWITALTAGLLALGFGPRRYARLEHGSAAWNEDRTGERGRGRSAHTPSDIPMRGWKDILLRVFTNISKDRVVAIAAGVTFYSILALFPAIAALVSLYGLFADPANISSQLDSLSGVLPGGAMEVVGDQMHRLAAQGNSKLGLTFIIGLLAALWSANAGIKALFDALNLVYNEPEKRGLIKLNAISLAFTTALLVFVLLALGAMVILPPALDYLGLSKVTGLAISILRWPALLVVVALLLAMLYRFGPSREKPRWRWLTWGSAFAAVAWLVASLLFTWYAANFGSYNKTYGSLGAAIGFMVWIWISTIVILVGAELNAEMEHQTARDTTTGRQKPMGSRGATMADTVGASRG
jgi:membrane protein